MIFFEDFQKRLVIPAWLGYENAVKGRELTFNTREASLPLDHRTRSRLLADYTEFKTLRTPHEAADLMGSAFVVGEIAIAKELAQFVKQSNGLQKLAMDLAEYILDGPREVVLSKHIPTRIAENKQFLSEFPHSPLGWIQQARLYTILGHPEKATKCVRIALQLAPVDRYVVRSAIRFFVHVGDCDSAWYYVKRASALQFDPWIKATEVSVAELMEKNVTKLKHLLPRSPTPDQIFHYSELIEAVGMLELLNGNDHRARKDFKLAWLNPSRNVITHSEWVIRTQFPNLAELAKPNFGDSLEATTLQNYFAFRLPEALHAATEWALEEPFSKRPFALGSSMACSKRDFVLAARIARDGLTANPREFILLNNLCFALLRANKIDDATKEFKKIPAPANSVEEVVFAATQGLFEFKSGNIVSGQAFYREAIAKAIGSGDRRLSAKALLNFAITELEAGVPTAKETAEFAMRETEGLNLPDVVFERATIETLYGDQESVIPLADLPADLKHFNRVTILPPKLLE